MAWTVEVRKNRAREKAGSTLAWKAYDIEAIWDKDKKGGLTFTEKLVKVEDIDAFIAEAEKWKDGTLQDLMSVEEIEAYIQDKLNAPHVPKVPEPSPLYGPKSGRSLLSSVYR